jgi:hypothetical protein
MEHTKIKIPTGVRVIAVVNYVAAALGLLGILIVLFAGAKLPLFGMLGLVVVIPILIMGILGYAIGRGLYKGRNWARIFLIIVGFLTIINTLFHFTIMSIIPLAINVLITGYLLFNKKVKAVFVKKEVIVSNDPTPIV